MDREKTNVNYAIAAPFSISVAAVCGIGIGIVTAVVHSTQTGNRNDWVFLCYTFAVLPASVLAVTSFRLPWKISVSCTAAMLFCFLCAFQTIFVAHEGALYDDAFVILAIAPLYYVICATVFGTIRFRFRLRTVFAAVTLSAVTFGLIKSCGVVFTATVLTVGATLLAGIRWCRK